MIAEAKCYTILIWGFSLIDKTAPGGVDAAFKSRGPRKYIIQEYPSGSRGRTVNPFTKVHRRFESYLLS